MKFPILNFKGQNDIFCFFYKYFKSVGLKQSSTSENEMCLPLTISASFLE